jgi:hypothetical protein
MLNGSIGKGTRREGVREGSSKSYEDAIIREFSAAAVVG